MEVSMSIISELVSIVGTILGAVGVILTVASNRKNRNGNMVRYTVSNEIFLEKIKT